MKTVFIIILLILAILNLNSNLFGQDSSVVLHQKNAFFVELGGAAGLYSINYQRIFLTNKKLKISGRGGFSSIPHGNKFPLSIFVFSPQLLLGSKHNLEIGFAYALSYDYDLNYNYYENGVHYHKWEYNLSPYYSGFLGYHYLNPQNGFLFRLGYSPIIQHLYLNSNFFHWMNFTHWFGIGVGTAF